MGRNYCQELQAGMDGKIPRVHWQDPGIHEMQFRAMRRTGHHPRWLLDPNIIGNKVIQPSKETKFLGVTFKQNLSWKAHVKSLITKARCTTSLIKLLKGETWATPRSLIHLTGALVWSRLTYRQLFYHQWQRVAGSGTSWASSSKDVPRSTEIRREQSRLPGSGDGCPCERKVASDVHISKHAASQCQTLLGKT